MRERMDNGSKMSFSIVIPTYNAASTLQRALESIRKQGRDDLEVIVIDGGSGDNTQKIVKNYEDIIKKYISERDNGIYDAINKGIQLARGELICAIGADDEFLPDALRQVDEVWRRSRSDIIAGRAIMVSPDGTFALREDEEYGKGALLSGIPFCHNAMFVSLKAYQRVGGYFLRYRICADAEWVHRAIRQGCSCTQIEFPIVRFSLGGLSSTNSEEIMTETYASIAQNFQNLKKSEAEALFRAVRGWSDGSEVESVLQAHRDDKDLLMSAAIAFNNRARRITREQARTGELKHAHDKKKFSVGDRIAMLAQRLVGINK